MIAGESRDEWLSTDCTDKAPFGGLLTDPLAVVPVIVLLMLAMEGVLEPDDLFFRKVVIFRKPLLNPECLFLSISATIVGISKEDITLEDLFDKLVLGRLSLESQEVGAVDCDMIDPW